MTLPCHPVPAPCPAAGYGNTGPRNCASAAANIVVQSITDLLLNAVVLGLIFAKVRPRLPQPCTSPLQALLPLPLPPDVRLERCGTAQGRREQSQAGAALYLSPPAPG